MAKYLIRTVGRRLGSIEAWCEHTWFTALVKLEQQTKWNTNSWEKAKFHVSSEI